MDVDAQFGQDRFQYRLLPGHQGAHLALAAGDLGQPPLAFLLDEGDVDEVKGSADSLVDAQDVLADLATDAGQWRSNQAEGRSRFHHGARASCSDG